MPIVNNQITRELENMCRLTVSDFSALAIIETNQQRARWRYAFGGRSERYKQMMLKPGLGSAGLALRTGKPVIWDEHAPPNPAIRNECPLMTAEHLRCAAAFPISSEGLIKAVLLVARRTTRSYADNEITTIQNTLHTLIPLIDP